MKNGCVEKNGSKLRAVAIKINEYHKDNLYKFIFVLMLFSNCDFQAAVKRFPLLILLSKHIILISKCFA